MSTAGITLTVSAQEWQSSWRQRWHDAKPSTRTRVQVGVFLGVILAAYHYSLVTLVQSLGLNTPLAYVGLVPVIALGLAAVRSKNVRAEPAIFDRQVDYIVGLPLVATALALNFLLPRRLSAMFWVWRIDLLSLPFFVAGVGAIIFGIRAVWRQRLAILYLFLVWPVPFSYLLLRILGSFTNVTLNALTGIASRLHIASAVPGSGGSIFRVVHNGQAFPLSVVSACSGVNGMVGFLLVGAAFAAIVTGPRLRKTAWLAFGLVLLWGVNLFRLVLIFWTAQRFGEHFAIQILHPVIGLITFNFGVLLMVVLLRPAGLRIGNRREPSSINGNGTAKSRPPASELAVPRVYSAIALVVILGAVLGMNNSTLRAYDLVANVAGEPKLASYLYHPASPAYWPAATFAYQFDFAKPYFGERSQWYRWYYTPPDVAGGDLSSTAPVVADVVDTTDLSSFTAYGVEACYRFHGYTLRDLAQVSLGGGIVGQALSYTTSRHDDWTLVYWIWPVISGTSTHYERVILYLANTASATIHASGSVSGIRGIQGALNGRDPNEQRLINNRAFLVAFAREVIRAQVGVTPGSILPRHIFKAPGGGADVATAQNTSR